MLEFTKKYQVWEETGPRNFICVEYDTLQECIMASKSGGWYITKRVALNVADADEVIAPAPAVAPPVFVTTSLNDTHTITPEAEPAEDATLAAYLGGPVGNIG